MELFALSAVILYLVATYFCISSLLNSKIPQTRLTFIFGAVATISHLVWLGLDITTSAGSNLSILNVAALISLFICIMLTFSINQIKILALMPIVYGVAVVIIVVDSILPTTYISHLANNPKLIIHITTTLLAYATLTIASLFAIQMAYLDYQLKHKTRTAMHPALPPLMTVEKQLIKLLILGLLLLTFSLLTSFIFFDNPFTSSQGHKTFFAILAWILYAVLIWGHFRQGWRSNKIAYGTLSGSVLLAMSYFGSRFIKEIILG